MRSVPSSDGQSTSFPQHAMNEFWETLVTKSPSKVTNIFPPSLYADLSRAKGKAGTSRDRDAAGSYECAAAECRNRVQRIARECRRTNEKFTDLEFDVGDLSNENCLRGLKYWYDDNVTSKDATVSLKQLGSALSTLIQADVLTHNTALIDIVTASKLLCDSDDESDASCPGSVHRIDWIFDKPQFEIDGFDSSDVIQGSNGDCWFIAAVATICSNPELMRKICVEKDEECGVYGFVFFRDGEWIWTAVDDNLYLRESDFDVLGDRYDPTGVKETVYRRAHQTGSKALHFASCANDNETWLPLLEKAYAKVHGDYDAITGGISGEAVEDLTGGVTTRILTDRVLSREHLWKELLQANKQFLFSASSPASYGDDSDARRGLAFSHAYSIIKAVEAEAEDGTKKRFILVRNPWGKRANASVGEWTGPWADGSCEWTPYWMKKLEHKFGDDGLFWMTYADLLQRFNSLDRTRLFNEEWSVVQRWTSVPVAWVAGYSKTKFLIKIKKAGPTVFVLCQLDDRYIRDLEGKYSFNLHFILQRQDAEMGDHIVRARGPWFGNRSTSAEIDLEAGTYEVLPKIEASRDADALDIREVVTKLAERNPHKLKQIGLNYDIANAKGLDEVIEQDQSRTKYKKTHAKDKRRTLLESSPKEMAQLKAWLKAARAERKAWTKEKTLHVQGDFNETSVAKESANLWNAVCVVGLRVYSQGGMVSISLVKPGDEDKSAI